MSELLIDVLKTTIIIPFIVGLIYMVKVRFTMITKKVIIEIPNTTFDVTYYLLHIRDGKDEHNEKGPLKNKKIAFKKLNNNSMYAKVNYKKKLGFQFKCFASCDKEYFDKLIKILNSTHYHNAKKATNNEYIWFLLKNYHTYRTIDNYENNYFHEIDHI